MVSSVSSVAQTVVGPGTIAVVAVVGISLRLGSGGGLSISGPLAVVDAMMSIGVSGVSVVQTRVSSVSQTITIGSVVGISIGLGSGGGLSISRPLSVVEAMMSVRVSSIAIGPVASIGVRVAVVAVEGISLSLRLGLWLTGDEGGKANHKSELHCYLSVESRIPAYP